MTYLHYARGRDRHKLSHTSTLHVTNSCVAHVPSQALYDSSDNLESVELTSSTRRHLTEEETDATLSERRHLDFADCADCAEVWDVLCYAGVSSVCDLVDFGSLFSTKATASMDTACVTFGSACSSYKASTACEDQCTNEGLYHHNPNTLGNDLCGFQGTVVAEL